MSMSSSPPPPRTTKRKRNDDVPTHQPTHLQFFVHTICNKTLVIRADSSDTVRSIYEKVESISNTRLDDRRLIYRGRQLQDQRTLAECGVENDASLHLTGRMHSSGNPRALVLINDIVSLIFELLNNDTTTSTDKSIASMLQEYLSMIRVEDFMEASGAGHLRVFQESSVIAALVMLYVSPVQRNKDMADEAIKTFVGTDRTRVPDQSHCLFVRIVLEFCKLLRVQAGLEDSLYIFCRSYLGIMLRECIELRCEIKGPLWFEEIFPFVSELAGRISRDLSLHGLIGGYMKDLVAFLTALRNEIEKSWVLCNGGPIRVTFLDEMIKVFPVCSSKEVSALYEIFLDLLGRMDICMKSNKQRKSKAVISKWNQYLSILKELYEISKLYYNGVELFGDVMKRRSSALNYLVLNQVKRSDGNKWIFQYKEAMSFEARRHLAMMMLPEKKGGLFHKMLINRSQLLSESFEDISCAKPELLHRGLSIQFKNELAIGQGVTREWFVLVCQAIFDPQKALYLACPTDQRRSYPNPASKVDPLHLKYFNFSGRVIALALLHKIQVGIVFDRVFFKQLAGDTITLEDVRDADPCLYNSCKQILEMDPEAVDQDALGLTFVHEIEELGTRKLVELCPGGKNIAVNSKNRKEYVDVLIRHLFIVSIAEQIDSFAEGFADIASSRQLQKWFFKSLNGEDLDMMLYGTDKPICVDDWKAHTEYHEYIQSDDQISWFWEIVASMSPEQKRNLLFFWTSVKYLPVEGFKGLTSKLYIYKSLENSNLLPTSHTCFNQLILPLYPSCSHMRERLHIIGEEHVGCSFGAG